MAERENFITKIRNAWNVFNFEEKRRSSGEVPTGVAQYYSQNSMRMRMITERTLIPSIYTRISIDAAAIDLKHARVDDNDRYLSTIRSYLNDCLQVEANIDQGARHFRQDIVMTLLEKGYIAIVPVETTDEPINHGGYDILSLRVGEIVEWYTDSVRVRVYNELIGDFSEVTVPKRMTAIVENPLYAVMNEPNSTMQRLSRKLSLLDTADEQMSSGKLDIIIQLPYVIRSDERRQQAEQRRKDIEMQLKEAQYGIAYTDGTEKITQLNRPAENNMLKHVEYLSRMLFAQLGLTEDVFNGTADEKTMLNYHNRTIEPILTAVVEAMNRTFLTKTARSQKQAIIYTVNPFRLVPVSELAEIGDKLTRNEILTSNEFRGIIGYSPVKDPKADELRNKNLPLPDNSEEPVELIARRIRKKEPLAIEQ